MQSFAKGLNLKLDGPILITGHTGFKGTWMTLLLERLGVEVIGYSKPATRGSLYERLQRFNKIHEDYGDVRDIIQFKRFLNFTKPSVIFHLAAQPLVVASYEEPLETFEVNVMGTANVLEAAANTSFVKIVVVVTSDKVYANNEMQIKFKEEDVLWSSDPYSTSKVGAELVSSAWRNVVEQNSYRLRIVTVRSGNVIGGGDNAPGRLMTDLIEGFLEKKEVIIKNPESTRPWQHVLDPLYGYLLAAQHKYTHNGPDSYNFGPQVESLKVRDVLKVAQANWPQPTKVTFAGKSKFAEKKFLDLDSNRANSILNWTPNWTQESAVISTLKWWELVELREISEFEACNIDLDRILSG